MRADIALKTPNLVPNSKLCCVSIVADVPYPIIGINVFHNLDLQVDVQHRKTANIPTSLTETGSHVVVNRIKPEYAELLAQQAYNELICSYLGTR